MTTPDSVAEPRRRSSTFVSAAMTVLLFALLLLTGMVVGALSGFGMSWFSHYWPLGFLVQVGTVAGVLAFLVLLYALTRLAAWGSRRQSGATGFAAGYILSLLIMIGYLPGGDIIFSAAVINYVFLFGSMVVLAAGVMRSATFPLPGTSVGRGTKEGLIPPDLRRGMPGSPFGPPRN